MIEMRRGAVVDAASGRRNFSGDAWKNGGDGSAAESEMLPTSTTKQIAISAAMAARLNLAEGLCSI